MKRINNIDQLVHEMDKLEIRRLHLEQDMQRQFRELGDVMKRPPVLLSSAVGVVKWGLSAYLATKMPTGWLKTLVRKII